VHKTLGDGMITLMFLWIFYRAKQDGLAVLGIEVRRACAASLPRH